MAISLDGYKALNSEYENNGACVYDLKNDKKAEEIMAELKATFSDEEVVVTDSGVFSGIGIIIYKAMGIILTLLLSDAFIGAIFEMFGLYNYSTDTVIMSGKIKKVTPRVLVTE